MTTRFVLSRFPFKGAVSLTKTLPLLLNLKQLDNKRFLLFLERLDLLALMRSFLQQFLRDT